MKKQRRKYSRPKRPWDKERIERERKVLRGYGLRRKKEIWRMEAILRDFRRRARELVANKDEEQEKMLIEKLNKLGLLPAEATLDNILGLSIEGLLERRLQTLIFRRGMANTLKQARQFIVHGHVAINGRKARWPSQLVKSAEEAKIGYYGKSQVKNHIKEEKIMEVKEEMKKISEAKGVEDK